MGSNLALPYELQIELDVSCAGALAASLTAVAHTPQKILFLKPATSDTTTLTGLFPLVCLSTLEQGRQRMSREEYLASPELLRVQMKS